MSDWIDFDRWKECPQMQRPGYVFEIRNAQGRSILTECDVTLQLPPGWASAPVQFRLVKAPAPRRSTPIPKPRS